MLGIPRVSTLMDASEMRKCERVLVYLNGLTWTGGDRSAQLAAHISQAMDLGVELFLAHEMPGIGGQSDRHACNFDALFSNTNGATPQELLTANIYSQIATPLKGGAWRDVSMVMVMQALANPPLAEQDDNSKAKTKQVASGRV